MHILKAFAVFILCAGGLAACTTNESDLAGGGAEDALAQQTDTIHVRGSVTYRERIALPPGSSAIVSVLPIGPMDVAVSPVATVTLDLGSRSVPVPFDVKVSDSDLDKNSYVVRAVIQDPSGRLLFTTDNAVPVNISGGEVELGMLVLRKTAGKAAARSDTTSRYLCGDTPVRATFADNALDLIVLRGADPIEARLEIAPSGSGARYEKVDERGRIEFWEKGKRAMLTVYGRKYAECSAVTDSSTSNGGDMRPDISVTDVNFSGAWSIEDVGGMGIVDSSAPQIVFAKDGTVTGRTGCNSFRGQFTSEAGGLRFSPLAMTRKACPPSLMRQESRIADIMKAEVTVQIAEDGAMELTSEDGVALRARRT